VSVRQEAVGHPFIPFNFSYPMLDVLLVTGVTNKLTCANKGMGRLWELARVYLWKGASSPQVNIFHHAHFFQLALHDSSS